MFYRLSLNQYALNDRDPRNYAIPTVDAPDIIAYDITSPGPGESRSNRGIVTNTWSSEIILLRRYPFPLGIFIAFHSSINSDLQGADSKPLS